MKNAWNWFINLSLLLAGIEILIRGLNSIIHFGSNSYIAGNSYLGSNGGYGTGFRLGYEVGSFLSIPVAIAILYLFYERVFKTSVLHVK